MVSDLIVAEETLAVCNVTQSLTDSASHWDCNFRVSVLKHDSGSQSANASNVNLSGNPKTFGYTFGRDKHGNPVQPWASFFAYVLLLSPNRVPTR